MPPHAINSVAGTGPHAAYEAIVNNNPDVLRAFTMRTLDQITLDDPGGVANTESEHHFRISSINDCCELYSTAQAWIDSGSPNQFARGSLDSSRQQNIEHGRVAWTTGARQAAWGIEFWIGDQWEDEIRFNTPDARFDPPRNFNGTQKQFTFLNSSKWMEYQTAIRGNGTYGNFGVVDDGWGQYGGWRYYGMGGAAAQSEILENHIIDEAPIEIAPPLGYQGGYPPGTLPDFTDSSLVVSPHTRIYRDSRTLYTYDDVDDLVAGNTTKPLLTARGEWHALMVHIIWESMYRVRFRAALSSTRVAPVWFTESIQYPGEGILLSTDTPGSGTLREYEFSTIRVPECNSSQPGRFTADGGINTGVYDPFVAGFRNTFIIVTDENGSLPDPYQPSGVIVQ